MGERKLVEEFVMDPTTGRAHLLDIGEIVGCVGPRIDGGWLAATQSGIYSFDPETGQKQLVADIEADRLKRTSTTAR